MARREDGLVIKEEELVLALSTVEVARVNPGLAHLTAKDWEGDEGVSARSHC